MSAEPFDLQEFRGLMRNVPGQVSIIATAVEGQRKGLTASAVCSLTDQPPTVIVCIDQAARARDMVESGYFSVNALAAGQAEIAGAFSALSDIAQDQRFQFGDWSTGITGSPILASAVCRLECRVSEYRAAASHTVFFGQVISGSASPDANPLLHLRGAYVGAEQRSRAKSRLAGADGGLGCLG